MNNLHDLLNWKLLKGSHDFPGPDGGTCINEAALVVDGFEYRSVHGVADLPLCFSRPIAAFAIQLNDRFSNADRQRLVPFVTRLAGSADTQEVEFQRVQLIVLRTTKEIVAPLYDLIGLKEQAESLRSCDWGNCQERLRNAADAAAYAAKYAAAYAAYAADAADAAAYAAHIVTTQLSILDEALSIGKQAEPIEIAVIKERVQKAKELARV